MCTASATCSAARVARWRCPALPQRKARPETGGKDLLLLLGQRRGVRYGDVAWGAAGGIDVLARCRPEAFAVRAREGQVNLVGVVAAVKLQEVAALLDLHVDD